MSNKRGGMGAPSDVRMVMAYFLIENRLKINQNEMHEIYIRAVGTTRVCNDSTKEHEHTKITVTYTVDESIVKQFHETKLKGADVEIFNYCRVFLKN